MPQPKGHKTYKIKHGDDPRRIITGEYGPSTQPVKQQEQNPPGHKSYKQKHGDDPRKLLRGGFESGLQYGGEVPGYRLGGKVQLINVGQRAAFGNLSRGEAAQAQKLFGGGGGGPAPMMQPSVGGMQAGGPVRPGGPITFEQDVGGDPSDAFKDPGHAGWLSGDPGNPNDPRDVRSTDVAADISARLTGELGPGQTKDWTGDLTPRRSLRYQQGGPVQRPTHATHNEHNQRMIAHFGRRNPQHAKHLMQGLRREHNGLRAMASAALAHSYGLRSIGRHELAHGHDAHALHLLNMAHAKVPDGAEVNFGQHDDHHFNANVRRQGRESNFPLNRKQLMMFAMGPAGGFDHTIHNGVEKNLHILQRGRQEPRGYQGGGPVDDSREWDPATQSYFSSGTPPAPDPDAQVVRQVLDDLHRDHGLGQPQRPEYGGQEELRQQTGALGRAGVPVFDTAAEPLPGLAESVRPGGSIERGIEERHRRYVTAPAQRYLEQLLHPTTANSASSEELQRARDEAAPRDVTFSPEALIRPPSAEGAPTTTSAAERATEPRDYYSTPLLTPQQALERGPVQGPSRPIYDQAERPAPGSPAAEGRTEINPYSQQILKEFPPGSEQWQQPGGGSRTGPQRYPERLNELRQKEAEWERAQPPLARRLQEPLDPGATPAASSPARITDPMQGMDPAVRARLLADPEVGPLYRHQMETAPRVGESVGPAPVGPTIEDVRTGRYTLPKAGYGTEGALPAEIPAGFQTQPLTMERFKEMWQRGRVFDPRQPAAERGAQVEEPDFIKQVQTQARSKNTPEWDRWANNLESYLRQAERGGAGLTSEQQAHLAQAYKTLNPDARLMPDVVPTRLTTADPAIIQQARQQYPNDPRAREAFINANWNRITPELQTQRQAGQDRERLTQRMNTLMRDAETARGTRGGAGQATELTKEAHRIEQQVLGIQPTTTRGGGAAAGPRLPTFGERDARLAMDRLMTQHRHATETYGRDPAQWPEPYRSLPDMITELKQRVGGGGGAFGVTRQQTTAGGGGQPSGGGGPVRVNSIEEARRLPSGTQFIDPNGTLRRAP